MLPSPLKKGLGTQLVGVKVKYDRPQSRGTKINEDDEDLKELPIRSRHLVGTTEFVGVIKSFRIRSRE